MSKKKNPRQTPVKTGTTTLPSSPIFMRGPVPRSFMSWIRSDSFYYSCGLLIVCGVFLGFALVHLGKFITTDETVWLHVRVQQYWHGLLTGDFEKTFVSGHPGIILSILAGISGPFIRIEDYTPLTIENYLFWWRMPGLVFNLFSLILIYKFIKELTDKNHALLVTGLIAFTPVILGMSKIPNSDSYVWNTGFISILTFLLYLRTDCPRHVLYCGVSFGMSLLSKFAAASLYLFFFSYLYIGYLSNQYEREAFLKKSIGFLKVLLISWGVFALLLPATLLNPRLIYEKTLGLMGDNIWNIFILLIIIYSEALVFKGRASGYIRSKIKFPVLINAAVGLPLLGVSAFLLYHRLFSDDPLYWMTIKIVRGHGEFLPTLMQSMRALLKEISIPTLISLFVFTAIACFPFARKKFKEDYYWITVMLLSTVVYKVGSSMKGIVSGGRYDILLFPMLAFASGGFYLRLFPKPKIVIPALLMIALVDIILLAPVSYLDYSNDKYFKERGPYYSWGMGGYELAQQANHLPEARSLKVLSDYHGFGHFFVGKNNYMNNKTVLTNSYLKKFDYLCLSSSGKNQKEQWHWMTRDLKRYYQEPLADAALSVGSMERGYVKLVKVHKDRDDLSVPGTYDHQFFVCLAQPLSMGFWLRTGANESGHPVYIGESFQEGISLRWLNDKETAIIELQYNDQDTLRASVPNDGQWHHVLFYQSGGYAGAEVGFYVDGLFQSSFALSEEESDIEKVFINKNFSDRIQDIRIYDAVLSKKQVNAIYNNGTILLQKELSDGHESFKPVMHFVVQSETQQ